MLYIYTAVVNNPKFIEMQHLTNKRFVKEDYKFIVYNDAKDWADYSNHNDINIKKEIIKTCERLNIECINIPNEHHKQVPGASDRTAEACNYMLIDQRRINDKALILDSDMFIVNDVNISEKYADYEMAIVPQKREKAARCFNQNTNQYEIIDVDYIWNGLAYFDMSIVKNKHLLDFNGFGGRCGITDTGGNMFYYLHGTPDAKIYNIQHLWSCTWDKNRFPNKLNTKLLDYLENDPKNQNDKFFAEIYDEYALHYRAGGNWEKLNREVHIKRTNMLWDTLVSIVKE